MLTRRIGREPPTDQVWAADNGRFADPASYTDDQYLAWLDKMRPFQDRCLFATAPDIVGDAPGTLMLSAPLYPKIRALGYRVALVAQDGLERLMEFIPWDDIDVLFIGGSTEWKLSPGAFRLGAEAKARGKWLHMGRVNSLRRMRLAAGMGCDSVDGTFIKFHPGKNEPIVRDWMERFDGV